MLKINRSVIGLVPVANLFILLINSGVTKASEERSYNVLEGDNLLVNCSVTDSPDIEVFWTKNGSKVSFVQQGKLLEILHINRSYTGNYVCHVLNTTFPTPDNNTNENTTVEVISVNVQYPAEVDFFDIQPFVLLENSTFNVTCDMVGNPLPVWLIRNRDTGLVVLQARESGSNITMGPIQAQCEHMGYWECTGYNSLNRGVNASKGYNLTVYCSPRPQYQQNKYIIQTTVGKYTEVKMYLQAYPRASYAWSKDDGSSIPKSVKQDDFAKETALTFSMISVPDFGNYTLKMQNVYGTYFAHYQIVAYGPPEEPTHLNFSDVTYKSVKLHWTSGFDMGSRQRFIAIKLFGNAYSSLSNMIYDSSPNHGINQNWTYVLTGLVSDTHYNLTIVSRNEDGFTSTFAKPAISFKTEKYTDSDDSSKVKLALGLTLGIIGTLGMLAFMVYVLKYKRLRTSYSTMDSTLGRI